VIGRQVSVKSHHFWPIIHRMNTKTTPDLNLLLTLEALLIEQNVTRAAQRLHLSQPAVSAQLRRLRTLFDDPLLIPLQRGMAPTSKALELLEPLRRSLDQLRATVAEHHRFDPEAAALDVNIACTDYVQAALAQPFVLMLRQRFPGVRVALHHLDPNGLEARMAKGDIDLALMTPGEEQGRLRNRHLFDEHYVLIGRRGHPALCPGISAAQFCALKHVIVSLDGGAFSTPLDIGLAALGHQRKVVLSASSFLFVPGIVAQSDLVALVPARLVRDGAALLEVVDCAFPVPGFSVSMLWHERHHGHHAQRWLRAMIVEFAGRL
jgi:DNA-binding transcriptional LysR family regulator